MFTCTACLRRYISVLSAEPPLPAVAVRSYSSTRQSANNSRTQTGLLPATANARPRSLRRPNDPPIRTSATLRGLVKGHHIRTHIQTLKNARSVQEIVRNKARNPRRASERQNAQATAQKTNAAMSLTEQGEDAIRLQSEREAAYYVDPLRLANAVATHLSKDEFDRAYEMVLASDRLGLKRGIPSGGVRNIVSWNHLIDWSMSKKEHTKAIQLYNAMKKRGHEPDSHTFTLLLRGLGHNVRLPQYYNGPAIEVRKTNAAIAEKAMELYNAMFRPNSVVQVKTLHTNALINILARVGDMDALWSVAGRMPERGAGAPDHWTYTCILNSMHHDLLKKMEKISAGMTAGETVNQALRRIIQKCMTDARQLWREVIIKWRNGEVTMDEKLVAAMGRLLLLSKTSVHVQDIFALIKQTMGISVDRKMLDHMKQELENRNTKAAKSGQAEAADAENDTTATDRATSDQADVDEETKIDLEDGNQLTYSSATDISDHTGVPIFEPVSVDVGATKPNALYATASNNTLSLLLETTTLLRRPHVGRAYWELLTSKAGQYRVEPDATNLMNYLRLLRVSRSSQAVLDIMLHKWEGEAAETFRRRGAFVVAMSTCVRDKLNPNVFDIASRMIDVMQSNAAATQMQRNEEEYEEAIDHENRPRGAKGPKRSVERPEALTLDPKVLQMYLELGMYTTKGINSKLSLRKTPSGDLDYERDPAKNNTMKALARLRPDVVNVHVMLKLAIERIDYDRRFSQLDARRARELRKPQVQTAEHATELLALLNSFVSAYDRILYISFRLDEEGLGPLDKNILREIGMQKGKFSDYARRLNSVIRGSGVEHKLPKQYDPKVDLVEDVQVEAKAPKTVVPSHTVASLGEASFIDLRPDGANPTADADADPVSRLLLRKSVPNAQEELQNRLSNKEKFRQEVASLREQGKPLSRRHWKYEQWLTEQESRQMGIRPSRPGWSYGQTKEERGQQATKTSSAEAEDTDAPAQDLAITSTPFPDEQEQSSLPYARGIRAKKWVRTPDGGGWFVKKPGPRERGKLLSRRQKQERDMEFREDKMRREMVDLGLSERAVRERRRERREGNRDNDDPMKDFRPRDHWTPSTTASGADRLADSLG